MHILPIQIGLIQSNLGCGRTENKAEQIVGLVGAGMAFIPKDEKGRVKNDFSSLSLLKRGGGHQQDRNAQIKKTKTKQKFEEKTHNNAKMQS